MIPKITEKPTMMLAGPGAGKTTDMVTRIVEAIPELKPNRILAAITFTNAATDSIKSRLQSQIQIPPNVFVGTNYSFFNQFILIPFASLFGYIGDDKVFLEIDVKKIVDKIPHNKKIPAMRNKIRSNVVNKLLKEGKVPFGQIAWISAKLMEDANVRGIVCNRIQFLFKDEFQDTDTVQLKIFDAIRKGKKTKLFSVGDPEQYILGFTYDLRGVRKPSFDKIPINRFAKDCEECQLNINRRACEQIVKFTNQFHTSIKQVSEVGHIEHGGVFFIEHTDLDLVISIFIEMTEEVVESCEESKRLFLGYENKTYEGFVGKYGLIPISNEYKREKSILAESLDLISSATQLSRKAIREEYNFKRVGLRKLGIRLMKAIMAEDVGTKDELIGFIKSDLGIPCMNGALAVDSTLNRLSFLLKKESEASVHNFHSSIHKAKGLEAECVLVVAKTLNELKSWIETEFKKRCEDKQDTCRIGFVGFTRAKQILCIACKASIGAPVKEKLKNLGVTFIE
jgi:DNA helicase-2/ATP-dependent DNA helicase PcrA